MCVCVEVMSVLMGEDVHDRYVWTEGLGGDLAPE